MPGKRDRRNTILELVRRNAIDSQRSLAEELARRGIRVSQATLSRDIQELGLVKAGNRYVTGRGEIRRTTEQALRRVLRDYVVEVQSVAPLMVIKTGYGNASTVGEALDASGWPEIVGSIAGENTIFVLCRSAGDLRAMLERIQEFRS